MRNSRFWTFNAKSDKTAELLLYGEISSYSWWGDEVTPKQFDDDLKAMGDIDSISLRINSPGGDVFAAQAIYTMLRRHSAKVTAYVDGLAASAATLVLMAGDEIIMPANAMLMVHNPWTIAMGNSDDLRKMADDLDKAKGSMLAVYIERTGMSESDLNALLDAETWLSAEEAVGYGFADSVEEMTRIAACVRPDTTWDINGVQMNLSRFSRPPLSLLAQPEIAPVGDITPTAGLPAGQDQSGMRARHAEFLLKEAKK